MDIICDKCQSKFKIPENKIPPGKTASFLCRKCKSKITVSSSQVADESGFDLTDDDDEFSSFVEEDAANGDEYDVEDKPFDFAEEEGETALVCESDPSLLEKVLPVLDFMEYHVTDVNSTRNAIKKMRYHDYNMVVVNEDFDTKHADANGVMIFLSRIQMLSRRNMFVVLLTQRFRTMDNMMTLNKSANLIINLKDINDFDKILKRGLSDNDMFYRVYKESLKSTGIS